MKIGKDSQLQLDVNQLKQQLQGKETSDQQTAGKTNLDGDSVELSLARQIAGLSQSRTERIAEIKEAIAKGEYKPNAKIIAEAVSSVLDEEVLFDRLIRG